MLSVALLASAADIPEERATMWLPYVIETATEYDIVEPVRLAMWIAQCAHESAGFMRLTENLNYSAAALHRTWPKRFPTTALADEFAERPEAIANKVYGGRMGNNEPGDGWRFRGRGLIQLTGRTNYRAAGAALRVDLLAAPDQLATPRYASMTAGWFWKSRDIGSLGGDVKAVTRRINGGSTGLADRMARYTKAIHVLEAV